MSEVLDFYVPGREEFRGGYEAYNQREVRGPIYFQALYLVSFAWGDPAGMENGFAVLVRGWNYLFANFDPRRLMGCIERNLDVITQLRDRDIDTLDDSDHDVIKGLFNDFVGCLQRVADGRRSAVSAAKALNPLAPSFLPLWDNPIAGAYGCLWFYSEYAGENYVDFCGKMKIMAEAVRPWVPNPDDRSVLKRIDEYNYAKYTRTWI